MPKLRSYGEFNALLETDDPLRLVLRGQAGLEALVNKALEEALGPKLPHMTRGARLDIAVRLGLLSHEAEVGLAELNRLRDKLAHGDEDKIPPGLLGNLTNAVLPLLGGFEEEVRRSETAQALRWILVALHLDLHGSIDSRRNVQESEQRAIERDREARRKELTLDYINQLLAEAENERDPEDE